MLKKEISILFLLPMKQKKIGGFIWKIKIKKFPILG